MPNDLLDEILPTDLNILPAEVPPVEFTFRLTDGEVIALNQIAVLMKMPMYDALRELIRRAAPSPNGQGYPIQCFGCGAKGHVKRRPIPGRHAWCDTCKASGEPAAQRARDYRNRKHEGGQ
jgi:hypothetical protein